jgi:acyl-coenzyme A synthetase/AMP-(fatty) acid ligase
MSGNLFAQLQEQALRRPDAPAIVHSRGAGKSDATSFAQLAALARTFAAAFHRDAASAAIVPLFLGKSAQCVAAMIGAIGAGKAFACLNKKLRAPQLEAILKAIGPTCAMVDVSGILALEEGLTPGSAIADAHWTILRDGQLLPRHQRVIERMKVGSGASFWPPEGAEADDALPSLIDDESRPGCCLFTSGSTGVPKGVLISESDLRARAAAEIEWFGIRPEDVLLSILPFSFDVGLNQLLTALTAGCTLVLLDSWLPADILRVSAEHRITGISAVPAIWLDMLNGRMKFQTDSAHSALRYITLSGGDMNADQLQSLPRIAPGVGIHKTYGQTEAFRATALRPEEFPARPLSVGRAFHGVRIRVIREDQTICAPGEEGEIIHTGLGTMLGYLDGADPQDKLRPNPFQPDDPATMAIFTGDLGHMDEAGYLFLHGRRDAMLKISGNRVYPREVANHILALPGVLDAEVVGVKSPDGQTRLIAFVVAWEAMDGPGLRRALVARLPSYMLPEQVVPLAAIPRTASGKPDRPALTDRALRLIFGDYHGAHA